MCRHSGTHSLRGLWKPTSTRGWYRATVCERALNSKPNPEQALLLSSARTRIDDEVAERIRRSAGQTRWVEFVGLARSHGVSPLVYHNLRQYTAGIIPESAFSDLRNDFESNAYNTALLALELVGVVRFLADSGIESVAFKGPVLARSVYGEVWLRRFTDLDLLVPLQDVVAAKGLLRERGYAPSRSLSAPQDAVHVRRSPYAYAYTLTRQHGAMVIDLHWRVGEANHPSIPSQLDHPWSRLVEASINGHSVRTFPPEDTLLLLCVHAAKHSWSPLKWVCDIAEFLRANPDLNWDRVQTAAADTGVIATRTLLAGVWIANLLLDAPLPDQLRRQAENDRALSQIVTEILPRLGGYGGGWPLWWPRSFQTDGAFLRMADGPVQKVAYFLRFCACRLVAPDAKDRALLALPAKLSFIYYFLRPPRLIAEYGFRPVWDFCKLLAQFLPRR